MIVKNQDDIITILKIQMKNKNISNSELARRLGLSQPAIARVLNNNTSIKLDTLFKYLNACGLSLDINITADITADSTSKDTNKDS